MKKILAFDIGGTKIAYAIIDEKGNFVDEVTKIATHKSANEIYDFCQETILRLESKIDGVSIATAGAVNNDNNKIISHVGNLPDGYNQLDFMSLTTKPVFLENDANATAWAEFMLGAAKETKNTVVLTLGTGVGAGIIIDGKLLKGKSGAAGEMHFRVNNNQARQCSCGLSDCLEIYTSGTALTIDAKNFIGEDKTSYDVISGIQNNNPQAIKAFHHWQSYLENALVMIGNIFDPEVVVLSGSMAQFVEYDKLSQEVNNAIITPPFKLKQARFKNNAGMLGSALLLLKKIFND